MEAQTPRSEDCKSQGESNSYILNPKTPKPLNPSILQPLNPEPHSSDSLCPGAASTSALRLSASPGAESRLAPPLGLTGGVAFGVS